MTTEPTPAEAFDRAVLVMESTEAPQSQCAHCGAKVSTRGRPPKRLGVRYCSAKPCRSAKAAALRALEPKLGPREAPTTCAGCGDPLQPRPWRSEDALGRFCRKRPCQRQRDAVRSNSGVTDEILQQKRLEAYANTIDFLGDALQEERVHCPECHLRDAVPGWPHLTETGGRCDGTTSPENQGRPLIAVKVGLAWVGERRYDHPDAVS